MNIETITGSYPELAKVAGLYARVFAGWPWFEVSVCSACGQFSREIPGSACSCNSKTPRIPAYPTTETSDYIFGEISRPMALALLGFANDRTLAGFGWGYPETEKDFALGKYRTSESQNIITAEIPESDYFYVSEVGVDPQSQTKGLGTEITARLSDNPRPLLLRTLNISPMAKIARKLGYVEIIGPDKKTRDPENPDRIIFIKD